MSLPEPEIAFEQGLRRAAARALGVELESVPLSYPPGPSHGDLASPVCFELARTLRKPPDALSRAIAGAFEPGLGIERVEAAGGYLNAVLDRTGYLRRWLLGPDTPAPAPAGLKIIVEHTNINPNKAAHIGHLRNAVLGDTLVRFLRALGHSVEVQNYIDDTGVQVADLVVGFRLLRGEGEAEVRERYAEDVLERRGERFDWIAWDLYAEVTRFYEEDPARLRHREETLHAIEAGDGAVARFADYLARRMVRHHLRTMHRIGVRYDLLPRESDILRLRFWEEAFARLRESNVVRKLTEGKNAGCWVMELPGVDAGAGEDQKVIVRSTGTVTYVGKDIAYQMWKLGLLGRDFRYEPFDWSPDPPLYPLWATTSGPGSPDHPPFGAASRVYNVIDARQSYLQRVVVQALRSLGFAEQAASSVHFAYEMVALSPATIAALFPDYPLSDEERAKPFLEMSGRRGLGVKADELVDALIGRAEAEVRARDPNGSEEDIRRRALSIAVGALRYYMLRFSRNRVVAFDLDDALAFEGETGPYLQYSVVRARNILAKVAERRGAAETDLGRLAAEADLSVLDAPSLGDHWELVHLLWRIRWALRQAVETLELASVAKHAYILAQAFNSWYHRYPVAQEADARVRTVRTAIVRLYHDRMAHLLELMGIEVPDRM